MDAHYCTKQKQSPENSECLGLKSWYSNINSFLHSLLKIWDSHVPSDMLPFLSLIFFYSFPSPSLLKNSFIFQVIHASKFIACSSNSFMQITASADSKTGSLQMKVYDWPKKQWSEINHNQAPYMMGYCKYNASNRGWIMLCRRAWSSVKMSKSNEFYHLSDGQFLAYIGNY